MPGRGHRHDLQGIPVLVVENVQDYRECVPHYVTNQDVVLEAGAAQGCTTSVIARHAAEVIGIDKSPFNAKVAQSRYPSIKFYELDAADISGIHRLGKQFTKIFLDISGSQPIGPLATLLEKYERAFPSVDLFVVKSYRLKKLVGCSTVYPEQVLGTTRNATAKFMLTTRGGPGEAPITGSRAAGSFPSGRRGVMQRMASACLLVAAFSLGLVLGMRRRPQHG